MDMPASWAEAIEGVDWAQFTQKVADYGSVLAVLRSTWSKETLGEINEGRLFVPDDVLNDAIKQRIPPDSNVTALTLHGQKNGRLLVQAETRSFGAIELQGEIKEFVHQGDASYMVYRVREKNLPNHGLMSWVFSRISLSMAERMVGKVDFPDSLPTTIKGNTIRVDCSTALAESQLAKTEFQGHRLLDMVEIEGATPKEGGIEFDTKLNVPDDVRDALKALLKDKMEEQEGEKKI